jgi:hypothetical protein
MDGRWPIGSEQAPNMLVFRYQSAWASTPFNVAERILVRVKGTYGISPFQKNQRQNNEKKAGFFAERESVTYGPFCAPGSFCEDTEFFFCDGWVLVHLLARL